LKVLEKSLWCRDPPAAPGDLFCAFHQTLFSMMSGLLMTDYESLKRFALSLAEVSEEPHHHYSSFRVRGKIFVTVPPDQNHVHVFPSEEVRERYLALQPEAFEKLFWGAKVLGLRATLARANPELLQELVVLAHRHKAPNKLRASQKQTGSAGSNEET
jgi:hypothetical protein